MKFIVVLVSAALLCASRLHAEKNSGVVIGNAAQPQLAVGGDGRIWLAYGQLSQTQEAPADHSAGHGQKGHRSGGRAGDVWVASSSDGGNTFGPGVKVAAVPGLMLGNRRGPRIAAFGDRLTVTVVAHELISFSSTDGGKSWSAPVTINDVPTSAREGLHDLAVAPDGGVFVTWLDLRNGKMELWGAASADAGKTWAANAQIYRSPDKSICECCHPSALFDAAGNLAVMWRNSIDGCRDMWMTTRAKGAAQFAAPRKLGEGTWKLNACPMDGGRILGLGQGRFGAVWQRNGVVFLTREGEPEIELGKGKQPIAVGSKAGAPLIVWQQGTAIVARSQRAADEPVKLGEGQFPSAVALPNGQGVLVAYERGSKGATSVAIEKL